ncbi:uncharacterized protein LOC107706656, partial [Sinocyclocheilus rhinocerous]|uniref:uncharacterized protein LOC107706656 n=1 Tax=Sinocyclocheilus rhinocerous TaxID=307959 RepID=UPI0007BA074C
NTPKPVSGKKGGNVTLTCKFGDNKTFYIELFSLSEHIDVCQTEECSGRAFKEGNCSVVIKDLRFSDAGKYILRVHYNNDQTELKRQKEWTYQLHIHDEITVKTGKPLKLHVLLSNADKVEKNSSGEWREVWNRTDGVQSDRMNDTNGTLSIKAFTASDAGTYRVLDSEEKTLITVTVTITESGTESKDKLDDTDKGKTNGTEQQKNLIVPVVVCLVILVVLIVISVIIWRRQHRDHIQVPVQENTEPPQELEEL